MLMGACGSEALAAEVQAVGRNTLKARSVLESTVKSEPGSAEAERAEWARATAALAFLEFLEGNESEASYAWRRCGKDCRKHLPVREVRALDALSGKK